MTINPEEHTGLVRRIAFGFRWRCGDGLDFDDLLQAGMVGCMHAAKKFDPERGYQFSTYASYWIRQAVQRECEDRGRCVRIPVGKQQRLKQEKKPLPCRTESYDAPIGGDPEFTLLTRLSSDAPNPEQALANKDVARRLTRAMSEFPDRTRFIIHQRFVCGRTLGDIGNELGVTRERVRQIQNDALARLRRRLAPVRRARV